MCSCDIEFYYRGHDEFGVRFLSSVFAINYLHNPLSRPKSGHRGSLAGWRSGSSVPSPILEVRCHENGRKDAENPLAAFVHVLRLSYSPLIRPCDFRN